MHIADIAPANIGTLSALRLDLHGSQPTASLTVANGGTNLFCTLLAAAAGWTYALEVSPDLLHWADLAHTKVGLDGNATFALTNALAPEQFFRARLLQ